MPWELAWNITTTVFNYTNHTLLPEALETWPVPLMERLLPRHMQIIYLINALHLDALRASGQRRRRRSCRGVSLIEENDGRRVRMGHLAFLGSHRVNGVSALHTELMSKTVFRDLHALYPDRIVNKTNGITFRRWLYQANPGADRADRRRDRPARARRRRRGSRRWRRSPTTPRSASASPPRAARTRSRSRGSSPTGSGIGLDPDAMFDVQIKRIHEYKRQLLNILETIALYNAMRAHPTRDWVPRVKIFAGKAAAGYQQAKLIIKLANDVARDRQPRPGGARPAEGRVPAELQREPRRGDHPGGRPLRADLDRRAWRPPAPAT